MLSLRLTDDQLASLRKALQDKQRGWHEVEATDGAVLVDLARSPTCASSPASTASASDD